MGQVFIDAVGYAILPRMELPNPPDQALPHRAVGLHCKIFEAWPDKVWDNEQCRWLESAEPLTSVRQYEDRVHGWFIRWGEMLSQHHDAGFVVLMVAVGYLEGNQQFRNGESSHNASTEFFVKALRRLFPALTDSQARDFYKRVRCGLFHDGMTKHGVGIKNRAPQAIEIKDGTFLVSPNKFLEVVIADFNDYVTELRQPGSPSLTPFLDRWNS